MVLQSAVRRVFSLPIRGLERFADNSNLPWNLLTIFHLDQIAEVSRMYLLSPCVLPVLQNHVSQNDEASKYNDSTTDLHRRCQNPVNCLCKSLSNWPSARETFCRLFSAP